ncbi:hypothetical protein MKUB_05370 [Mycobacterium kubicae]|uniref:Reverse transcriptase domain-containing protein n=1 Tax=Mycobacterium kubicae TaxID=120959 RepID=A0ABQ1BH62_9MYCO|nr:hypothetical protein MKUB_05370 [Mycobacterium kubicae]
MLDAHFRVKWDAHRTSQRRDAHRKRGGATYRIVRYADDFVIMVAGTKAHADALWDEVADVIAPLGLRLSVEDPGMPPRRGFDFLGFRIQRRRKKGTNKAAVYTYPSKKALLSIMTKVRALTKKARHHGLADLLGRLNPVLRGWCAYFRHGVSKATFGYLDSFAWHRVTQWLLKRHKRITWAELYRRFLTGRPGNRPQENGIVMFDTTTVPITRYRWRASNIPHRGPAQRRPRSPHNGGSPWSAGCDESRTSGAEGGPGKRARSNPGTAPRSDPYIIGKNQASQIGTLVERSTGFVQLLHLPLAARPMWSPRP